MRSQEQGGDLDGKEQISRAKKRSLRDREISKTNKTRISRTKGGIEGENEVLQSSKRSWRKHHELSKTRRRSQRRGGFEGEGEILKTKNSRRGEEEFWKVRRSQRRK